MLQKFLPKLFACDLLLDMNLYFFPSLFRKTEYMTSQDLLTNI